MLQVGQLAIVVERTYFRPLEIDAFIKEWRALPDNTLVLVLQLELHSRSDFGRFARVLLGDRIGVVRQLLLKPL